MQYSMQGEKLLEYELPFFTHSISTYGAEPCCAFYPDLKLFFYVEDLNGEPRTSEERVFYYDLDSGEKGMIAGIEGKDIAISRFYVVNETLLLVDACCHSADKGMLYLIDTREKKLVAVQEIPYPAKVSADVSLSRLAVFTINSKVIDIYDLRTLKHLFGIPQNNALYLTDCAFSPSGNIMLQAGLGDNGDEICLSGVKDGHWENSPSIFFVSTEEYFILEPQFYSDRIILFQLSGNQNKYAWQQLCFFDFNEKKIVRKYPVSVWGYSKLQGDYFIWEN